MTQHIRITVAALLIAAAAIVSSCSSLTAKQELDGVIESRNRQKIVEIEQQRRQRLLDEEVRRRCALIRRLIRSEKYAVADEMLASMESLTEYSTEISQLKELVSLARTMGVDKTELAIDEQRIINETASLNALPSTYGTTVSITPSLETLSMPKGPLESLLQQRITLKVSNMELSKLAMQLHEIDGLAIADPFNIIFSDAVLQGKTFSCDFTNVPLYELFSYIAHNLGICFNITENMIWVTTAPKDTGNYKLETRYFKLRNGLVPKVPEGIGVSGKTSFASIAETDTDLVTALDKYFAKCTTGGSYQLFTNRNLLIITDTRENLIELEKLVNALDTAPLQVVIEAKFITVSESDLRDIGVEITKANGGATGSQLNPTRNENGNISNFLTELGTLKSGAVNGVSAMTISGVLGHRSFDMLISALARKTSTVTLSAPRVTVMNNRTARIRKGDKLSYFEEYGVQSVNQGDQGTAQVLVPRGKPTQLQLGITFDVSVSIGNDLKTVMMGLKPEIINFLQWEDYTSSQTETVGENKTNTFITSVHVPRTHEQGIATSVAIKSGETVILGGMVENAKTTTVTKVPFLGDIPFIGSLFRHTEYTETPTNLLIFVTANIIDETGRLVVYEPPPVITPEDLLPLQPVEPAPTGN